MIVVTVMVATTPLEASQSCMSKTEARQHYNSSYIYWHGPDHCWDATPPRQNQIHGVRRKTPTDEVRRKPDRPKTEQSNLENFNLKNSDLKNSDLEKSDNDQFSLDQFSWRNSMSAMLPDAAASLRAALETRQETRQEIRRETRQETQQDGNGDRAASLPALDRGTSIEASPLTSRWVDIAQVVPPPILERKPAPAPSVTSGRVVGLLIASVLAAGIALVFFIPIYQRRRSTTDIWDAA
jgi:hypothetical protein